MDITQKTEFLASMGANLRMLRKKKNLSLNDLARLSDFEKASLSKLESGKANPTVLTLLKLSKALGVPMKHFFNN